MTYVLWLLILIGVMIMVHELGHFWAARYFDVKVETFSLGFGPRLFGFKRGETDYRVSPILFGGYVKMAGADSLVAPDNPESASDPRSLMSKPRWQRLIISFECPFMNVVLAVGLLTGLYMVKFQKVTGSDLEAVIGHVAAGSAAAKAGIQDGDRIVNLDGQANPAWEDVFLKEAMSAGRTLSVTVVRNGQQISTNVTPVMSDTVGGGYAGWDARGEVELATLEPNYPAIKAGLKQGDVVTQINGQPIYSTARFRELTKASGGKPIDIDFIRSGHPMHVTVEPTYSKKNGPPQWMVGVTVMTKLNLVTTRLSLPDALGESVRENARGATLIVEVLKGVIERRMSAKNYLVGPIGLAQLSGDAAKEGPSTYLSLMAMISLNLAIVNLLPIPIMDGGAILMLLIEMAMRRDLSLNVKEAVFKVGFVFIMMLLAFVDYNDLARMLPAG